LQGIYDTLAANLCWLVEDLSTCPNRFYEIVPQPDPELIGAQDVSGNSMGGIWFPASTKLLKWPVGSAAQASTPNSTGPILGRACFTLDITNDLVSFLNATGQVTNSHLKLAALIMQNHVTAHYFNIHKCTISSGSDNTPTIA
jgi:hypothetical protein